ACAVNETGAKPGTAARRVCAPATGPRLQRVKALPWASVTLDPGFTLPPVPTKTQFKLFPGTPFPKPSTTRITTESVRSLPTGALWLSPKFFSTAAAAPGSAVAVKSSDEVGRVEIVAWLLCTPA